MAKIFETVLSLISVKSREHRIKKNGYGMCTMNTYGMGIMTSHKTENIDKKEEKNILPFYRRINRNLFS